jgi:hypothetical protein
MYIRRCQQYETHLGFHAKYPNFCPNLTKFGFSWQIFVEVAIAKFHRNPFRGNGSHTYRQTVGNDVVNCSFFSRLRERT